jgi:hypothetical protein
VQRFNAGWSSPVARQAHNLKVIGSNPIPATKIDPVDQAQASSAGFFRGRWPSRNDRDRHRQEATIDCGVYRGRRRLSALVP